jgi:hypothetical protein
MKIRIEFKPQDLWIGVFWKTGATMAGALLTRDVWACIIPILPIHVSWVRDNPAWLAEKKRLDARINSLLSNR